MKGKKKTPLPWYEWDFEKVPENERDWCALWEYARKAKWVAKEVKKWFSTPFPGYSYKGQYGPSGKSGKTVSEALRQESRTREDGYELFFLDALPAALKPNKVNLRRFCRLVVELPKFPTPWLKVQTDERQRAVETLTSMGYRAFANIFPAFQIEEFHEGVEQVQLAIAIRKSLWPELPPDKNEDYVLTVDWNECTHDKAVEQFKTWLKANPHRQKRSGGRKAERPIAVEMLRNLAALCWKTAGFEFTEAKAALFSMGMSDCDLLRHNNRKSGEVVEATYDVWRHRCASAEKTLSTMFPPPGAGNFGQRAISPVA